MACRGSCWKIVARILPCAPSVLRVPPIWAPSRHSAAPPALLDLSSLASFGAAVRIRHQSVSAPQSIQSYGLSHDEHLTRPPQGLRIPVLDQLDKASSGSLHD